MNLNLKKLKKLTIDPPPLSSADELRRVDNVFFVGGNLPERPTLETLYDSHYQSNASLFHLTFGPEENFAAGEALARTIKKNFHVYLMARFDYAAPASFIERAYAAGVDIVEFGSPEDNSPSLAHARTVFPRWSTVCTLEAGNENISHSIEAIERLLDDGVVPLVRIAPGAGVVPADALAMLFETLEGGWLQRRVTLKPLLPLIYLTTPFAPSSSPGALRGFIDLIDGRRLLATSDLRRVLRVKEVEASFSSSGL
ncbi:hypothetical protein L4X63_18275 [Geomonas sp. Red32]|uniref:hypothetical protein n=1 Tax=Geomonas sp. Red32 TaxID=2912856 RepID=UPI00202CD458|nr:hypothetical protein [Geomonas sp. Red32]MCM0083537.1 hypothetical protein [Geomonas sp. Red32]